MGGIKVKAKSKSLLMLCISILFLTACGMESEGKKVVEKYLDEVKKGERTYDYITFDVDRLIDVFEYEFISFEQLEDEEDHTTIKVEYWESRKEDYETFEDYKDFYKNVFKDHEIISESPYEIVFWEPGEYITVYKYLYNVTVANAAGEKLYKKIEFEVEEENEEKPMIRDIYIR